MPKVEQKVYKEDSDDFAIITNKTETSKTKQKELLKFDCVPVKDFITEANRRKFKHICNMCKFKNRCYKWQGKIILSCQDAQQK